MTDIITAEPGTVIAGTHNAKHLLEAFADALEAHVQGNAEYWCGHQDQRDEFENLIADARESDHGDDVNEQVIDELMTALDYFAPEGHTFAAHVGDGCDFGFWPDDYAR